MWCLHIIIFVLYVIMCYFSYVGLMSSSPLVHLIFEEFLLTFFIQTKYLIAIYLKLRNVIRKLEI